VASAAKIANICRAETPGEETMLRAATPLRPPDGLKIKLFNRTVAEPYTPSGIFVIDEWRKIGVTTEHVQVETKTYFDSLVSGNFDVALWPATEPADDPTSILYYFISHDASTSSMSGRTARSTLPSARGSSTKRTATSSPKPTPRRCCGGTASSYTTRRSRAGPCHPATSRAPTW
jgi:hypothetical protein